MLGLGGKPLANIPPVEFLIRPANAGGGEPKDVHIVVDFGNSRTGALLVEFRGATGQDPLMTPLQMINRYSIDAWDDSGRFVPDRSTWWFSSNSHWCTPPYLVPPRLEKTKYSEREVRGIFTKKTKVVPVNVFEMPRTFEDFSMVRMGREADDLAGIIRTDGEVRTGVSSPKRYLWAKDASWLEGAYWHMADPYDRCDPEHHATTLKGPLLEFFPEDDSLDEPVRKYEPSVERPRYAPRTMMTGALYEILCQAYTYANSLGYRHLIGDSRRMRLLRTLTLTFPSGMIASEHQQLEKQAHKAIRIFMQTLGKSQTVEPELKLSVDEASAVHLTYIWSEVKKLGSKTSLWFSLMGQHQTPPSEPEAAPDPPSPEPAVSKPLRSTRTMRTRRAPDRNEPSNGPEMRIACIDVGGGTSDLMIAKYNCRTDLGGDLIRGETLHRDGISLAGDHLVKRLLERIIVPLFADIVGLEPNDAQLLFGREVPASHAFRTERVHWMNRLFVPLAVAYLASTREQFVLDVRVHSLDRCLHVVDPEGRKVIEPAVVGDPLGWASPLVDQRNNTWIARAQGGLTKVHPDGRMDERPFVRTRRRFDCTGLICRGTLFIGCEDHYVYAFPLDGDRGSNIWADSPDRGRTHCAVTSPLALGSGSQLLVASQDNSLYGFTLEGKELWSTPLPGQLLGSPVVGKDGMIFAGISQNPRNQEGKGILLAIEPNSHRTLWQYQVDAPIESTPVIGDDGLLYFEM